MSDPRIGSVIQDRYRITEMLSSGGMGVVYRGERIKLGRQVAIKFLHAAYSKHGDFRKRFEREARLMSRLEHPHIVSVIDFGLVDDSPFIVMDFVAGDTLADIVDDEGPLEPARAIPIVRQILGALAHAHKRGIVHRDIKAANVMLTSTEGARDHVHLLDFGLAKLRDVDASLTMAAVGTPSYMSPEQAAGKPADARSDIYSTGVLLFELLAGEKPFVADEPLAVLQKHLMAEVPRLARVAPPLEAVVRRSLVKDPDERYQTPAEMSEALDDALAGRGPVPEIAPPPEPAVEVAPAPVARPARSGGGALWLLLVLGLGGGAAWWTFGRPSESVLAGTRAHIESRESGEEIRALNALLRRHPQRGDAARRLGDLYVAKGWQAEALAAYAKALRATPALRRDRQVIANVIRALEQPAIEDRARAILVNHIGKPAMAPLRAARQTPAIERTLAELSARSR